VCVVEYAGLYPSYLYGASGIEPDSIIGLNMVSGSEKQCPGIFSIAIDLQAGVVPHTYRSFIGDGGNTRSCGGIQQATRARAHVVLVEPVFNDRVACGYADISCPDNRIVEDIGLHRMVEGVRSLCSTGSDHSRIGTIGRGIEMSDVRGVKSEASSTDAA
jgi:hypothetical protein